ncbi:hypothetical protein BKA70DRAFT_1410923 [Coprinopsis sp. MPI-PUGE-AT-0042]|nr:hypothetical protein BKA70DRAFT_1410923 [Coprinopsis sp. MPI-PUGE-AT-0042]
MRFNIIVAVSLLCTLVSGFTVSSKLFERETDLINARREFLDFANELAARTPKRPKIKGHYRVAAGGGKPAQTYTRQDIKKALKDANAEHQRHKSGTMSGNQKKKSLLKPFSNTDHQVPKPGAAAKSLPDMKGTGYEYPLRTSAQGPATAKDKGPARIIMKENSKGTLKFQGVVAHDQSRPLPAPGTPAAPGTHDHFEVKGRKK